MFNHRSCTKSVFYDLCDHLAVFLCLSDLCFSLFVKSVKMS